MLELDCEESWAPKNWCFWWGQEEKGMTEDEMAGWQHRLDEHEFEWTPGVGDGEAWHAAIMRSQRVGHDWATKLNWTELKIKLILYTSMYIVYMSLIQPFHSMVSGLGCRFLHLHWLSSGSGICLPHICYCCPIGQSKFASPSPTLVWEEHV